MTTNSSKPDYGIDAPGVIRNLVVIGVLLLLLAWLKPSFTIGPVTFILAPMAIGTAILLWIEAMLMILYSKYGKFRHRDRMLSMVHWKGNEQVLDVGTGRGLLMIAAAKRLTSGKSYGIDIWSARDLSGNSMEAAMRNATSEGVRERVEVQTGNATALAFPENTFDVILSNLCIHNILTRKARDKACQEIVRVLKPGGVAVVSDYIKTADYMKAFQSAGATASRTGMDFLFTFPWLRIVEVRKPKA